MVDILSKIKINADLEKVASYAADPDNAPIWYKKIKKVKWETEPPIEQGSLIDFEVVFIAKKLAYTYHISKYIPNRILIMSTSQGTIPIELTYTWKEIDNNSTEMTLQSKGTPKGLSKIIAPLLAKTIRKNNENDLISIKKILENN